MINQFIIVIPEILLASLAMVMQIVAVYTKNASRQIALATTLLGLGIVYYMLYFVPEYELGFTLSFATSPAISLFKAIVLGLALMSLVVYRDIAKIANSKLKIEFITLVLLSTLGVFISISARDFMLLFCGLELQALSGYALAAFNTKSSKSSEAGLKYFILGALMSGLMLLGISFLYGFSGSIKFFEIRDALNGFNIGLIVGSVLVLSAILFKLSAAPLHIWTPDVYEGAPISAVTYFAVAQKIGMLVVLINITDGVIGDYTQVSNELIKIVAILSMIVGSLGAIRQVSLKRLMAYSTVLNVGYVLVGVCLHSPEGNYAAFVYMLIYVIGVMGFFACIVALFGLKSDEATFEDLQGIAGSRKTLAAAISIIMFSMIGLPPLAGFFGKYYIFYNAVAEGEIVLAIIGVLTSVIAAFYYLKIIKCMYFMEPTRAVIIIPTKRGLWIVTVLTLAFILFFFTFAQEYIL
ncbi:NADH-quinone oxidoreductase subunit N [Candidatus Megaera venefica]|uniref:NADH-quinone oxidoreductase subunit N n=1 Tax=Candidatus Megaera venefica TaxID=2055910 RepID=A0ABU5NBA4_9RICK|nr:NADH-quinone oxidoreductase subunit N [Candidatus Megaera venefica]MEA0970457.1 NADH-quinone oxidoreductase subunit N [Candidatus Megaera venefica]